MCVILYKPKKIDIPKKDILKTCYTYNRDGVGYTFTNKHNVIIKKGYKDFNIFYNELLKDYKKYNLKEHNLIIHFRIGTSGGLTKEKTQPFKITNNIKELNKLYIKNKKSSIVHNGVFSDFTYNSNNSDTQNYIKDFLHPLLKSDIKNKTAIINDSIGTSKLAILTKNDNVKLYGDFIEYKGVYYSNNSFNNYTNKLNSIKYNFKNNDKKLIIKYDKNYFNNDYTKTIWKYNYNTGQYYYDY